MDKLIPGSIRWPPRNPRTDHHQKLYKPRLPPSAFPSEHTRTGSVYRNWPSLAFLQMPHLHIHSMTFLRSLVITENMALRVSRTFGGSLWALLVWAAWRTCQRVERLSDGYFFFFLLLYVVCLLVTYLLCNVLSELSCLFGVIVTVVFFVPFATS